MGWSSGPREPGLVAPHNEDKGWGFLKIDGLRVIISWPSARTTDLHLEAGIARPVHPGKQLHPPVVFDRVVTLTRVFEADGLGERQFGVYRAVSRAAPRPRRTGR